MTAAGAPPPLSPERDTLGLFGHPRGLMTLFLTEMWERFSYYGMRAILMLFMVTPLSAGGLGFDTAKAAGIYGLYTGSVYFTTIPGGFVADRLLGLRRAVLIGAFLIAAGHYSLFFARTVPFFYSGLALIIAGTGLLKANISSIVGQLYQEGDERRDSGFSIFYMGINLGALVSPLICGWLAQRVGWHWGFGAAGLGMTFGLLQYAAGQRRFERAGLEEAAPHAGRLWLLLLGLVLAGTLLLYWAWDYRGLVLAGGTVVLFVWLLRTGARTPLERKRILAIIVLFVFAILFWMIFEQAGSSLTLFADKLTRNEVFSWSFPSSWYQSVEPVFVVTLAPVFAFLWLRLGKHEPSSPAKFAFALVCASVSFFMLAFAAHLFSSTGAKVSPYWLVFVYLLHAMGELSLSPVGLSTVTKLAPLRIVGLMMGVWFLALSLGNFLAGAVASFFDRLPLPGLFSSVAVATGLASLVLLALVRPLKDLMGGIR